MTVHRFFVDSFVPSSLFVLDGPEAHHAIKVLRLKVGEEVELFDGQGFVVRGRIESLGKREMSLALGPVSERPLDHNQRLHFAVALPKGDRQRSVLEKLVELGVDSLTPLNSRFSVAEVDEGNRDRLVRYALEACKQCERNRNLMVRESVTIAQAASEVQWIVTGGGLAYVLHPAIRLTGVPAESSMDSAIETAPEPTQVLFLIGPEGGFTDEEVLELLAAGAKLLSLGERILRVETAVSAAAVLGQIRLGSQGTL